MEVPVSRQETLWNMEIPVSRQETLWNMVDTCVKARDTGIWRYLC